MAVLIRRRRPGELQYRVGGREGIVRHGFAPVNLAVKLEGFAGEGFFFVMGETVAHKFQIVFILVGRRGQEQFPHRFVHRFFGAVGQVLLRQGLAKLLGQIGMPAGPFIYPLQGFPAVLGVRAKPLCQRAGLLQGKIPQLDAIADIEGGAAVVFYQIRGRGHAQQYKGEALEDRLAGAGIITGADGGEEIIGEWQGNGGVDFIHKDHHRLFLFLQHCFAVKLH